MHIHGNNATRYGKPTTAYRQNDCISKNALRLLGKIVFVIVLPISGSCQSMVYYIRGIIYNVYSKFPVGSSAINQNSKKARALTGSTFGIYSRFRWIQTKQEPVDSLYNYFNDTVHIAVMFVSALQPNTTFNLSKHWASIRGVLIYWRKNPCMISLYTVRLSNVN